MRLEVQAARVVLALLHLSVALLLLVLAVVVLHADQGLRRVARVAVALGVLLILEVQRLVQPTQVVAVAVWSILLLTLGVVRQGMVALA
jgi:hypothetical protein|tara:strand:- start:91 stop:357 length:267 start_codon:yes stop_codon:yes gene_type:complete